MTDTILEIQTDHSSDSVEFTYRDGHLNITIDNPWAGDSETGFGQTTHIGLNSMEARKLFNWLGLIFEGNME